MAQMRITGWNDPMRRMPVTFTESHKKSDISDIPIVDGGVMTFTGLISTRDWVSMHERDATSIQVVRVNQNGQELSVHGGTWDPYAALVKFNIPVEARQYEAWFGFLGLGSGERGKRWIANQFNITLYADNLVHNLVPYSFGTSSSHAYEHQNSEYLDIDAYVGENKVENKIARVNSEEILSDFGLGKQVVEFEWKVIDRFLEIGDEVTVKNKFGNFVGGTTSEGKAIKSFRVLSVRNICKSTYSQIVQAREI